MMKKLTKMSEVKDGIAVDLKIESKDATAEMLVDEASKLQVHITRYETIEESTAKEMKIVEERIIQGTGIKQLVMHHEVKLRKTSGDEIKQEDVNKELKDLLNKAKENGWSV